MTAAPPTRSTDPSDPLAFLPRQDRHKPKCGPVRKSTASRKRAYVLIGIHVVVGVHIVWWLWTGSAVSPVEPSEAKQTLEEGSVNAGFVLFATLIAGTLIFGRFFCGWACHVVALQDLSAWLLGRAGLKPRPIRSRLLVLAPFVVAFHMFAWPHVRHWFSQPELPSASWHWQMTTTELWATFPGPIMGVATFAVVGFLVVWWLGAKGFCTHGCPYGAFFAVVDRFAPVRIKVTDACDGCGHCTSVCTSNVRVHEEVAKYKQLVDPGCMKCLDCVSVCPKDALYVGIAMPKPFATSQQRIRARADFTWPEEIALAVIAFVAAEMSFRGAWFGEGVPLLMSVGLGVITAVLALLGWRLVRRRDMSFQHTVLKRNGRWLRGGCWAFAAIAAWLLFTANTFVAQREKAGLIDDVMQLRGEATNAQLEDALAVADRALAWELVDDPTVLALRGLLLRRLNRHVEAEQSLLASYAKQGHFEFVEASLCLAAYRMDKARRDFALAETLVRNVLRSQPQNPKALQMLQYLESQK
jgi:polyferredoxin